MSPNSTHFIVKHSAAKMPMSCWGRYRRVAVLEVEADYDEVPMISERAKGVVRIVATWEKLNDGTSERCAFRVALAEAEEMADELNGVTA